MERKKGLVDGMSWLVKHSGTLKVETSYGSNKAVSFLIGKFYAPEGSIISKLTFFFQKNDYYTIFFKRKIILLILINNILIKI